MINLETNFDEVAQIIGIAEVNNCEIYNPDGLTGIRGLFPITSLMSHRQVLIEDYSKIVVNQSESNKSFRGTASYTWN